MVFVQHRLDLLEIGGSPSLRRQASNLDLDRSARLKQVLRHSLGQRNADFFGSRQRREVPGDESALTVADLDDSQHGEAVEGLAHCGATNSEGMHQLTL